MVEWARMLHADCSLMLEKGGAFMKKKTMEGAGLEVNYK